MKCKLVKISRPDTAYGSGLRTDEVVGETDTLPEIGKCFYMVAQSITQFPETLISWREVNTSPIVNMVLIADGYRVTTMSGSVYEIIKIND